MCPSCIAANNYKISEQYDHFNIQSHGFKLCEIGHCFRNGLLSVQHSVITWTSADLLAVRHLVTGFIEILTMITFLWRKCILTHWGRVTHICVGNLTIIVPDNGLSPGRRQAIIWTNAGILLIGPWGTSFSEMLIEINTFSFTKIHLKMSSGKWRPFCLGLNVLRCRLQNVHHFVQDSSSDMMKLYNFYLYFYGIG